MNDFQRLLQISVHTSPTMRQDASSTGMANSSMQILKAHPALTDKKIQALGNVLSIAGGGGSHNYGRINCSR